MERVGFVRAFDYLQDEGINIMSITTERHSAIKKEIATNHQTITHFFDSWHMSKGMSISVKNTAQL